MSNARLLEVTEAFAELRDSYSCPRVPSIHKHFVLESSASLVVTYMTGEEDFHGAYDLQTIGPIDSTNMDRKAGPGKDEMVYLVA